MDLPHVPRAYSQALAIRPLLAGRDHGARPAACPEAGRAKGPSVQLLPVDVPGLLKQRPERARSPARASIASRTGQTERA
jgi:hypothetical protein